MTTDPNRPSDPTEPPPGGPPPGGPPPGGPPPSSPPPVGAGDPFAAPGSSPGSAAPPAGGTGYPPAAPPPAGGYTEPPAQTSGYGTTPAAGRPAGSGLDLAKASTADRGIAAAAVLFLIALLLPWASVSVSGSGLPGGGSESTNGFSSGLLTLAWILLLAAAVVALLPAMGVNVNLPFPRGLALLGLTGLAALITLFGFIDALTAPDEIAQAEALGLDVSYSAGIGAYLGMLIALGAVALAFLAFRSPRSDHTSV